MSLIKTILHGRAKLLLGYPRRFFLNVFRPGYVQKRLAQRTGECRRCGTCCRLIWKCPHHFEDNGVSACKLYGQPRPPNCQTFPISHKDIADRDLVAPHIPCGYSWKPKEKHHKKPSRHH